MLKALLFTEEGKLIERLFKLNAGTASLELLEAAVIVLIQSDGTFTADLTGLLTPVEEALQVNWLTLSELHQFGGGSNYRDSGSVISFSYT